MTINAIMMNIDDKLIYEAYREPDVSEFRMTDEEFENAEKELGGMRLSRFVAKYDPDEPRKVSLHTTYVQKHYGRIDYHEKSPVTGESIADAIQGLGGGGLKGELSSEERMRKGYIVTKMDTGAEADQEIDRQARTSASVDRHYGALNRGETNYRGD